MQQNNQFKIYRALVDDANRKLEDSMLNVRFSIKKSKTTYTMTLFNANNGRIYLSVSDNTPEDMWNRFRGELKSFPSADSMTEFEMKLKLMGKFP